MMTPTQIVPRGSVLPKPRGLARDAVDRFVKNKLAVAALSIVLLFVTAALLGDVIAPYDPYEQDLPNAFAGPSAQHWLGQDDLGRDILSRLIIGSRTAMFVAVFTVVISLAIGALLGTIAGYFGGYVDAVIMWLSDVLQSIPLLLLAMIVTVTFRLPIINFVDSVYAQHDWAFLAPNNRWWVDFVIVFGAISVASWPAYARLIRGSVLSLSTEDYVVAARAIGASGWRVMSRHILPNALGPIIVLSTTQLGAAIVAEAGLSFLGVGVQPPNTSWGSMLSRGWQMWTLAPHIMFAPAIAVAIIRIAFNFFGDGLNDALNPRSGRRG